MDCSPAQDAAVQVRMQAVDPTDHYRAAGERLSYVCYGATARRVNFQLGRGKWHV